MAACDSQRPRSLNNDIPTYVQFVNRTGRMVYLFWLDFKGNLIRYGLIPPQRGISMNTFVTHPWVARDASTWYPLLLNGKQIFYPDAERGEHIFHDLNRDRVDIHIPVFPLFRRCLEVVYLFFKRETIAFTNIPTNIKDILFKMSPPTEFNDYALFDSVIYDHLHGNDDGLQENQINNIEANANDGNRDQIGDDVDNDIGVNENDAEDADVGIGDRNNAEEDNNIENIDDDYFYDLENEDASDVGSDDTDENAIESENEDYHDALEDGNKDGIPKRPM